jgi:hypothetical protein
MHLNFDFRKATAKKDKFPGFFASNSFNSTGTTNSNHHETVNFHDPSTQAFLK